MTTQTLTSHQLAALLLEQPDVPVYNESMESDRDGDYHSYNSIVNGLEVTPDGVFIKLVRMEYHECEKLLSPSKKTVIDTISVKMKDYCDAIYLPMDTNSPTFFENLLSSGRYYGFDQYSYQGATLWWADYTGERSSDDYTINDVDHVLLVTGYDSEWNSITTKLQFEEAFQYFVQKYNLKVQDEL